MKTYFVYIIKCCDGTYYTGFTNNIERRLLEHQNGYNQISYTYTRRPVELVFYEPFTDPNMAILFEKKIKRWSKKKNEALINENWDKLKELASCRNKTSHKYLDNE